MKNIVDECGADGLLSMDENSFADDPRNLTMNAGKIRAYGIELLNTMNRLYLNMGILCIF